MRTQDLIDKVLFHKTAIIKNMVAVIIMVAIFAFEGCFNFATMSWNVGNLKVPAFWVRVLTKVILFLAIKAVALLTFLDVARRTNVDLKKQQNINEKFMTLKGQDFPMYVENILNPSIKIEAWKDKIKRKLLKVERKAKPTDRALYFNKDVDPAVKEMNKYCVVRKELELELTDEWIKENFNVLNVRGYAHIDPAVFDIPVTARKENKYQLKSNTKMAIAISLFTGIIGLLITQSIWQAAAIRPLEEYDALTIWISMLMDLVFLAWQFFTGVTKAFQTVNDEEVIPYVNRNRILKAYFFWKEPSKTDNLTIWIQRLEEEASKQIDGVKKEGA